MDYNSVCAFVSAASEVMLLFAPLGVLVSCCCLDVYSSFLVFSRLYKLVIFEPTVSYCHLDNGVTARRTFSLLVC